MIKAVFARGQRKRIVKQTVREIKNFQRRLMLEIDMDLQQATPIDTGRARANWSATLNVPRSDWSDTTRRDPGYEPNEVYPVRVSGQPRVLQDTYYLTNNVPYILKLDDGFSTQAPQGYVLRTVDDVIATIGSVE